jgi:RND family efflux transporter MFP subunit
VSQTILQTKHIAITTGVVLAVCFLGLLIRFQVAKRKPPPPQATIHRKHVAIAAVSDPTTWVGVLVPPETAELASRSDGKIAELTVNVGDQVKQNDILGRLDMRVQEGELRAAEAQLGLAGDRARRRSQAMAAGGKIAAVSGEEMATAAFESSAAAAKVESLKAAIDLALIRAPFDGVVTAKYASAGNYIKGGQPVVRVIGQNKMHVRFALPDSVAEKVQNKAPLTVKTESGKEFHATIEQISPEVEPASRTIFVDAAIDNLTDLCTESACNRIAGKPVEVSLANPPSPGK